MYVSGFNLGNANCDPMTNDPSALLGVSEGFLFKWDLGVTTDLTNIESKDQKTKIYPTPVTNYIQLNSSGKLGLVSITDVLGKTIYEKNNTETDLIIDMSAMPQGIYFISVNGTVKKIIKK